MHARDKSYHILPCHARQTQLIAVQSTLTVRLTVLTAIHHNRKEAENR